jgi:hypothetical protein
MPLEILFGISPCTADGAAAESFVVAAADSEATDAPAAAPGDMAFRHKT